ncbi:probable inactive tRNA-specific adenosine deaminase-like protein 3 [Leptidea sinapis]|uniref:probable inactive tRNA-specific adenosine deaminase-like protein 3 n=1 Tax=Leptidea sinapis TaxID=189913 RepID=UPI00212ADDBA|nr:probable inactive tRNA-specific adenosine deaminase-like protein 3 [Leptidea sinapis]
MEPQVKIPRLMESNTMKIDLYIKDIKTEKPLKAVLSDEITQAISLIKVFTGHLRDVKDISKTVLLLNEKLPIKELQHLKRVKQGEIVICPVSYLEDNCSIEKYVNLIDEYLTNVFDSFQVVQVPLRPPKLKMQYDDSRKYWPCNFHPDKYLEKLVSNEFFIEKEIKLHRRYMELTFVIAKWYIHNNNLNEEDLLDGINTTVVVDPSINSVVAVSFDNRQNNPIQHSVMLAIDNVSKTQNGGAWSNNIEVDNDTLIDLKLLEYLKEMFTDISFGYRKFISKGDIDFNISMEVDGPYLCTGYHVYIIKEPCVMCSMALVHARVKKVFFCIENRRDGALLSKAKLQTLSSLNHRFEVFTGFL